MKGLERRKMCENGRDGLLTLLEGYEGDGESEGRDGMEEEEQGNDCRMKIGTVNQYESVNWEELTCEQYRQVVSQALPFPYFDGSSDFESSVPNERESDMLASALRKGTECDENAQEIEEESEKETLSGVNTECNGMNCGVGNDAWMEIDGQNNNRVTIDLTVSEVEIEGASEEEKVVTGNEEENFVVDLTTSDVEKEETVVWGGEASARDVVEIEKMLSSGSGVFASRNCALEVRKSLLAGAGRGVFVKEGHVINHRQCITRYSGRNVRSTKHLVVEELLRTVQVGHLMVVGKEELTSGDGFGSLLNSSVSGRTHSFCRFVSYKGFVYVMAHCPKQQYPIIGPVELYIVAGHGWWSLLNSLQKH